MITFFLPPRFPFLRWFFPGKSKIMKIHRDAKITPLSSPQSSSSSQEDPDQKFPMFVIQLRTLMKLYGGRRHPELQSYSELLRRGQLVEWRFVPRHSTTIYVSREWRGKTHPDSDGTQTYHLILLLERLFQGLISRTDMDPFHVLLYNHTHSTSSQEWTRLLSPEKTFVWLDWCCVPRDRREDAFLTIPFYVRRCDFTIVLAPGCTHTSRIDPRTQRKANLCYRTYRLRARCVFEMFSAFLTTESPMLLVRSGTWMFFISFASLST